MKTHDDLIKAFQEMTLLDLSAFVKRFEEEFGVTAQAPQAVVQQTVVEQPQEEEQDEFDVILESAGAKKIQVIKEVRTITKLGLADAKALVDSLPNSVLEKVDKETALKAKEALEASGATVTMK